MDTTDPVDIKVKKAKNSKDLEVVLKSTSKVELSPVKFPRDIVYTVITNKIMLCDLNTRNDYDQVTVTVKVIIIEDFQFAERN